MRVLERGLSFLSRINEITSLIGKHAGLDADWADDRGHPASGFFPLRSGQCAHLVRGVARFMMIWMTFLIAPVAYRHGTNVSLDFFASRITGRTKALLTITLNLLVILFLTIFFFESFGLIERGLKLKASTLSIKMAYIYMILPISFFLMFLVALELIGRSVKSLIKPEHAAPPKALPSPLLD